MKEMEFDIELTTKELYAFSMHHTYASVSGAVGVLISLGSLLLCAVQYGVLDNTGRIALIIIGCLFTLIQPLLLYSKARTQMRRNKDINACVHYCLKEDGITVSQGEQEASVKWFDVRKKVITSKAIYLYLSPVRAFIFPKEQCGDMYSDICDTVIMQMNKYKNYDEEEIDDIEEVTTMAEEED